MSAHCTQLNAMQSGFDKYTHTYLWTRKAHVGFKDTVVNLILPSFHEGSLETTLTVPLILNKAELLLLSELHYYLPNYFLHSLLQTFNGLLIFYHSFPRFYNFPSLNLNLPYLSFFHSFSLSFLLPFSLSLFLSCYLSPFLSFSLCLFVSLSLFLSYFLLLRSFSFSQFLSFSLTFFSISLFSRFLYFSISSFTLSPSLSFSLFLFFSLYRLYFLFKRITVYSLRDYKNFFPDHSLENQKIFEGTVHLFG